MSRPKTLHPTPAELEILKLLWERGPLTVREVLDELNKPAGPKRAYTSVMSLLNVMADKGLLDREPEGRAFRYRPRVARRSTLGHLVGDIWQRAFEGSATTLVAHLLEQAQPTPEELKAIRETLRQYEQREGGRQP
jgi:predicted transcriptional regulator